MTDYNSHHGIRMIIKIEVYGWIHIVAPTKNYRKVNRVIEKKEGKDTEES